MRLRRWLWLIATSVALMCGVEMSAQTHYHSNVSLGVKGGVDLSRVFFTPSVKQKFNLGMNAGVTFRYIEENHFGLIIEADLMQRGWAEDFEELPFKYSRTLTYVQIPFLAHLYFGRRGRFFINLGPSFGLKAGDKISTNFDVDNIANIPDFPNKNRITAQYHEKKSHMFDYGITAGLGGEFSINRRNSLYVEGRFYYGLAHMLPSKRTDNFRGSNSMAIEISLGYWFRIK